MTETDSNPLRVAFVLHVATAGGITRFSKALIDGMLADDPEVIIGFFAAHDLVESDQLEGFFSHPRVSLHPLLDPSLTSSIRDFGKEGKPEEEKSWLWKAVRDALRRFPRARAAAIRVIETIRRIRGHRPWYYFSMPDDAVKAFGDYDVVYMAFPFYVQPFKTSTPVVGTFHDVNHRHFPQTWPRDVLRVLEPELEHWTQEAAVVVASTRYIAEDLAEHYPQCVGKTEVIYLAPYSVRALSHEETLSTLDQLGLSYRDFVIYPCNATGHKNIIGFVRAADELKRRLGRLPLPFVITGFGTDLIGTSTQHGPIEEINDFLSQSVLELGTDLLALGYVTDAQVDALTRGAALVVSTSLYEAGCGPALDAWQFGVPVAFSDIPPFTEQLSALGVEAYVFDPLSSRDIADKILWAVSHREESLQMAERSKRAISRYTWADVGGQYLEIFARVSGRENQ